MSNLGQLRNNVRLLADVDATDVDNAEIARAIQYSYEEVIADHHWPWLMKRATFAGVVNQPEYVASTIASDLEAHRIAKVMTRGFMLDYITPDVYFEKNPFGSTASSQSVPRTWTVVESENLALWPPPDTTDNIQVFYARLPNALELDADVPSMPSRYHQLLETGALIWVYQKIGDFESAETKKKEFTDGANSMRDELLRSQPAEPLIFGGAEVRPVLLPRALWPWEM